MSHSEDLPEPRIEPTSVEPVVAPEGTADRSGSPAPVTPPSPVPQAARPAARPRWRKWLFYGLATVGALAIALIVLVVVVAIHHANSTAPEIDRDAQVDSAMTAAYGRYSEGDKGWLYVDPISKTTYVMQVIQRAKVDLPDTRVKGNTALYFVASGLRLRPNGDTSDHVLGLFVIEPDSSRPDNALVQISEPTLRLDGYKSVAAQDVRFEVLSKDTWGWVIKATRSRAAQDDVALVDNIVFAPHDASIERLGKFPALGHYTEAAGCTMPEAARIAAERVEARTAEAAARAASMAASGVSPSDEERAGEGEGDEVPSPDCADYSWTYRTGSVPSEGFVEFLVTGGGLVNGVQRPVKTTKLVFDPKSFTYLVPDELQDF
jgi:hypothetical protein